MGLQAECVCSWDANQQTVTAHLESTELILRGGIRRRIPLNAVANIVADGEDLRFRSGQAEIVLRLGTKASATWARKMSTPPPDLRTKLGLSGQKKAFVIGEIRSSALSDALDGAVAAQPAEACMTLAMALDWAALSNAIERHGALAGNAPIWIVHGKGRHAAFGNDAVRTAMRAAGFVDTKVTAVSDELSATRYSRRQGDA